MNIQNKPNIYTISNAPPPSYAEATGISEPRTYNNNTEFDQRCPRIVVCPSSSTLFPYPSNYYPNNNTPAQSSSEYQQNESAVRQNEPTSIHYNRRLIIVPNQNKGHRVRVAKICCWMVCLLIAANAFIVTCLIIFRSK